MNIELLTWLKDGKYRLATLRQLSNKSRLSSELANALEVNRTSMSRILRDLKEEKLVEGICNKTRTVSYILTKLGKSAIIEVGK